MEDRQRRATTSLFLLLSGPSGVTRERIEAVLLCPLCIACTERGVFPIQRGWTRPHRIRCSSSWSTFDRWWWPLDAVPIWAASRQWGSSGTVSC